MSVSENWGMFNDARVISSRAIFDRDSLGSPPKERFDKERWVMASVHTIIFNFLEAVYKNATHIAPNDLGTYLDVARECISNLELHHENEDTIYFPFFEKHMNMESNRSQHASFLGQVHATLVYLDSCKPGKSDTAIFSAKKLRQLIDAFLPAASEHMADELNTLSGDLLREHMTVAELDAAEKAVMDHNNASLNMVVFLPGMLYNRPKGCMFPDAPWFVTNLLAPIFSLANRGRWKYYWSERRWETTSPSPLT